MRKSIYICCAALGALLVLGTSVYAKQRPKPTHMDRFNLPGGCGDCHSGRGMRGTPLLRGSLENFCYKCHGSKTRKFAKTDIESEFQKSSAHPIIETSRLHNRFEQLPETDDLTPRHVSCYDCHIVHMSEPGKPWRGARGYAPGQIREKVQGGPLYGRKTEDPFDEYELCYKCHSVSSNLPMDSRNMALLFNPDNESFHPVEYKGRNTYVQSLRPGLTENSRIMCSDCHGNESVAGARGPHGSEYEPLLVAQYKTFDGTETRMSYALCYMCHDRKKVLGDYSFKKHSLHVVTSKTSCYTCHDAHGSQDNKHLISFNSEEVAALANTSAPEYLPEGGMEPRCFLRCHDVDHERDGVGQYRWQ